MTNLEYLKQCIDEHKKTAGRLNAALKVFKCPVKGRNGKTYPPSALLMIAERTVDTVEIGNSEYKQ